MANTIIRPTIFAKEVIRNRDIKNVFYNYTNSKFTWELKKSWDTVTVQLLPTLSFTTGGTAWAAITATDFTITSENLVIDQVAQLSVTLKDIEMVQSNLSLEEKVAGRFGEAEARLFDEFVRDTILADTNIETLNSGAPVTLTKTNVFEEIEKMKVALAENNVTDNLVLFVSPSAASLLRQSGLLDNTDTGLAARQKGYIGMISGVKIVETNALTASKEMIMMEEGAVNMVAQLNQYDVRKAVDGFYENLIAEIIYGIKIFSENAKAICVNFVA